MMVTLAAMVTGATIMSRVLVAMLIMNNIAPRRGGRRAGAIGANVAILMAKIVFSAVLVISSIAAISSIMWGNAYSGIACVAIIMVIALVAARGPSSCNTT